MIEGEPSRTALAVARHRALHQSLDDARIFRDPLAERILGDLLDPDAAGSERVGMRLFIAGRHRIAEDTVAEEYALGTRQAVVLGAGLDTFGYRNPHADLAVFEVDFPATGAWKRDRLAEAGIGVGDVHFVGVDFEHDDVMARLGENGFDVSAPAVMMWLGVVPYLTPEAVTASLRAVGGAPGRTVIFDYPEPAHDDDDPRVAAARLRLRERTAAVGEPMRSEFEPDELARLLQSVGFTLLDDLDSRAIVERLGSSLPADAPRSGGHIMIARTPR
jgi:methyltransferase (TIGR00027 family)